MDYVGMDVERALRAGQDMIVAAGDADQARQRVLQWLGTVGLASRAPALLGTAEERFAGAGGALVDKATLAGRPIVAPPIVAPEPMADGLRSLPGEVGVTLAELLGPGIESFESSTLAGFGQPDPGPGAFESNVARLNPEGGDPTWTGSAVFEVNGQSFIGIQPESLPFSLDIPNTVDARGFPNGSNHVYDITSATSIPFDEAWPIIGAAVADNPTPGMTRDDQPASPDGTLNDALAFGRGSVKSFVVASPDPARYTDLVVNYTTRSHLVREGYVVKFGERAADGTTTLHSYGEGNSKLQYGSWNPQLIAVWAMWETNHSYIEATVNAQLETQREVNAANPTPSDGSIVDYGLLPPTDLLGGTPNDFFADTPDLYGGTPEDFFAEAPDLFAGTPGGDVEPLDWFSKTANWDPGTAWHDDAAYDPGGVDFDTMWSGTWSEPTDMYFGDSIGVTDFL